MRQAQRASARMSSSEIAKRSRSALLVDELRLLRPQSPAEDRPEAAEQRGLEDVILIGGDDALHHALPESVGRVDEHDVAESALRVDGEHDACGAEVGTHHALHPDREGHRAVIEAAFGSIADGTIGEE
jgi:hypothetical protein